MTGAKAKQELINRMQPDDKTALLEIYKHRCLNENLLYNFIYIKTKVSRSYAKSRVKFLLENNLIEPVDYGEKSPALFLTNLGVKTLERIVLTEVVPSIPICRTASSLKMKKNILHQMRLNLFAMQAESYISDAFPCVYYDSKHMPPASDFLMPDGMLELPDRFLFLEMDMGTENAARLKQKWDSYRTFLNYRGYYASKPITMLFILEGVKQIYVRRKTVVKTINECLLDRVDTSFEVYIDSPKALHNILIERLRGSSPTTQAACDALAQLGFTASRPRFIQNNLPHYGLYVRKLNQQKIVISHGRAQEFLLDVWDGRLSVLHNIAYFGQAAQVAKSQLGRTIPYLVVLDEEKTALDIKEILGTIPGDVFFITLERMGLPWHEAVFRIDYYGNLVHFQDDSLSKYMLKQEGC